MRLIPYKQGWGLLDDMIDDMNSTMPTMNNNSLKSFIPAMDLYETDKEVIVEAPLAGVKPENVEVSVEKGILTISGKSNKEHEVDDKNYYRKEIRSGSFFRQVSLPAAVSEEKVKAEFEDGILKVTCPKTDTKNIKKINVKVIKKENKKK